MILNTALFNQTVEAAKAKVTGNASLLRAIDRAVVEIEKSKYWSFDGQTLTIQSTTSRKLYRVDSAHTCDARTKHCKHNIARLLMARYTERLAVGGRAERLERLEAAALAAGRISDAQHFAAHRHNLRV